MRKQALVPLTLLVLAGSFADAGAQSLGDIARREEERRKTSASGKTYTNSSLPEVPKADASAPAPVAPSAAAGGSASSADSPKPEEGKAPDGTAADGAKSGVPEVREKRDEKYWRGRAAELRGRREALQQEITRLEGQLKELESQAAGSASIARERDLTQTTLTKARQNLGFFTDEWTRFQQKAQSAKVPPEWLH